MIQAIIFDCFGVLATEGWLPFKERYFGHDPARMEQAGNLIQQANAGVISHHEFVRDIANLAGISERQVETMLRQNVPNEALFEYLRELKSNYKLGFLSNSSSNWLHDIFSPEQIALFDAIVLSYEAGMAKPDPRIYQLAAQKLAVEPAHCVFIDDQEWYATAAGDVGMSNIYYQNFEQMKLDLERILAKST